MATGDRIDPGPGWRLLEVGEMRDAMDEFFRRGKWTKTSAPGAPIIYGSYPTRRRIAEPRTIKGVATRATVRVVAADGEAERSMRCDSGLSIRQMHAAIASFDGAVDALRNRTSVPKYIMFEIQRGPNDC